MKQYKNTCINCGKRVDNRTQRCMPCYLIYKDSTKDKRKERKLATQRAWYTRNKEKVCRKSAEKSKSLSPRQRMSSTIKYKYGISLDEYDSLMKGADYKCQICGEGNIDINTPYYKKLVIDHCHTTDRVRGVLCPGCNKGLGHFKDDENLISNALKYLQNGKDNTR